MMIYKKAALDDAILLAQTRQKVWAATYRGIYPDEMIDHFDYDWHIAREQKNLQNPDIHTFLVMDGEVCAGYFTYICGQAPLWRDYNFRLLSLYLLPQWQNAGEGSRIFRYVINACNQLGFDKFFISCDPQNTNALSFYQHMGCKIVFEDVGNESTYMDQIELEYRTPKIFCRKATVGDAELIVRVRSIIWRETYRGIYPDEMLESYDLAASEARFAARILDPSHEIFLYFDGEDCIGYFAIGPSNFGSYKDFDLCLNNLYLRKEYKGLGLGKRAFQTVWDSCKARGISKFFCGCNYHNKPAMAFYAHMGGILGDTPVLHENKTDDIVHFEFYLGE